MNSGNVALICRARLAAHGMHFSLVALLVCMHSLAYSQMAPVANRAPLQTNAFNPLPLGSIRPRGWLLQQERLQAAGLTGHLGEFWNDVGSNSGWLGGTGESWERGPYYLDGLLPLAYQLQNAQLMARAKQWVDWSLASQQPDGQFGPQRNNDWWPRMVMLKVLTQYQEASGDRRVIPFLQKYFAFQLRELPKRPLQDWGKYRWQDNVYSVVWLYNRTGDRHLLALANLLHDQGYDWKQQFAHFAYTAKQTTDGLGLRNSKAIPERAMQTHGVNTAMALKTGPLWWLFTGDATDRSTLDRTLGELDKYHGLPNGMFSGDEHLAGPDPSQGIELCAVVESMFSLETGFSILGDARLADRLERITYNALPATLSDDMWSHQYDQQPNQIACTRAHRQWSTNGDDANLFGLAPNFGCCTANLHQGWPKFVSSIWMATTDGGLATAAYAPSELHTKAGSAEVTIVEETDYPFEGDVRFRIQVAKGTKFPLALRLPHWAEMFTLAVNQEKPRNVTSADTTDNFYRLEREWKNGDVVNLHFPMVPRTSRWYRNSAVYERGPLVFSLPLDGKWQAIKRYAQQSADWQVTSATPWNFGLAVGECAAKVERTTASDIPFDAKHPGVRLQVKGRRIPQWQVEENSAGKVPLSPVESTEPLESLTLVPYGAAKLRITAFPVLRDKPACSPKPADSRERTQVVGQ